MRLFRRRGDRSRAQGLVEFALVLPIFLLMVFGIIDVGRLVYQHTVLSQAAREGARLAAVEAYWIGKTGSGCGTAGGPVCPSNNGAFRADVLGAANRMIVPFTPLTDSQLTTRCDGVGATAPAGNWSGNACPSAASGGLSSVRVESTFTPITPIVGRLLGNIQMSASASMVIN